jgi:hypothetical protein
MFTRSRIALSVAVALGVSAPLASAISSASVARAEGAVKSYDGIVVRPSSAGDPNPPAAGGSRHARGSYAQVQVRPSPNVDPRSSTEPTGAARAPTAFEKNWFSYQDHDDQ